MLKNIKDKKIVIVLAIILVVLLIVSIILVLKNSLSKKTKEVSQEIELSQQNQNESEEIPQEDEVPPFLIDEEVEEEEEEVEEETKTPTKEVQTPQYYIKVNNQANVVTIYTKDSNGNYTVPYKAMVCSIGTATPTGGVHTIPGKTWDRWTWGQMVGGVWAQYYVRIHKSILFHSVPYTSKDKSTLEYWEYDKLGTQASAGCIRLTVADAKWIYDNCPAGTKVEFYYDANPGPLGKPTAQKISNEESVRGWDPTDPSTENPWRNYTPIAVEEPVIVEQQPETPPTQEQPTEVPDKDTENPTDDELEQENPDKEENGDNTEESDKEEQTPEEITGENPEEKPIEKPDENEDKENDVEEPVETPSESEDNNGQKETSKENNKNL